jgi:integrase
MYIEARKKKSGQTYYTFSYDKGGKRVRLKTSEHPYFTDLIKAREWADSQDAIRAAEKAYHQKKLSWKNQYYDFATLLQDYSKWQSAKAPNTYRNCVSYLDQWTFAFFLGVKKVGNVNNWHLFFQEFADWLQGSHEGKVLAASSVNNILKTTNTFITFLLAYNKISPDAARRLPTLPDHKIKYRTHEDVISKAEAAAVYQEMLTIDKDAAEFFLILYHTGLRFNELFGLSIKALFKGHTSNIPLHQELEKSGIAYLGYLYLESQIANPRKKREPDKSFKRKALKGAKVISPKNSRVIPIIDKAVWNILAKRYKAEMDNYAQLKYTSDKEDYIFFNDLDWNKATRTLREAYKRLRLRRKSHHSCRHSFTTNLVGETRNFFLVRTITGHKKDRNFELYLHIYEQIALESQQQSQSIEEIA